MQAAIRSSRRDGVIRRVVISWIRVQICCLPLLPLQSTELNALHPTPSAQRPAPFQFLPSDTYNSPPPSACSVYYYVLGLFSARSFNSAESTHCSSHTRTRPAPAQHKPKPKPSPSPAMRPIPVVVPHPLGWPMVVLLDPNTNFVQDPLSGFWVDPSGFAAPVPPTPTIDSRRVYPGRHAWGWGWGWGGGGGRLAGYRYGGWRGGRGP